LSFLFFELSVEECLRITGLQPGDRVIWLRSPGRSILSGWKVEEIPGVVVRVCRRRIRIRVRMDGKQKVVSADPDNMQLIGKCSRIGKKLGELHKYI